MRTSWRTGLVLLLIAVIGLAAGCTPKATVPEGGITAMAVVNGTSSGYDTVPLHWSVDQNTLRSSSTPALHVTYFNHSYDMCWSSGSPIAAVQRWDHSSISTEMTALLTATSNEVNILVPPEGMQYSPVAGVTSFDRWYVPADKAFVTIAPPQLLGAPASLTMTVTEVPLAVGAKTQTLTVAVPPALAGSLVAYGSGSISDGFVLLDVPLEPVNNVTQFDLWLLRMHDGEATLLKCSNPARMSADLYSAVNASFAHVGSLLYFTHGEGQIGYIDTTAAAPSIIVPDKINAFVDELRKTGRKDVAPVQAFLATDNGVLIVGYPDIDGNGRYYAVNAAGTVLGSLCADRTSVACFDAAGNKGTSLQLRDMQQSLLFPSVDLFASGI